MTTRDELRDWIVTRARSEEDASLCGKLVARFVADAVRADRRKKLPQVPSEPSEFVRAIATFFRRPLL